MSDLFLEVRRQVHQARQQLGERRQPFLAPFLAELNVILDQNDWNDPFYIPGNRYDGTVMTHPQFKQGATGLNNVPNTAAEPEGEFFYRLEDVASIAGWKVQADWTAPALKMTSDNRRRHAILSEDWERNEREWLRLADYAAGEWVFKTPRLFSFWTDELDEKALREAPAETAIQTAFRLGIASDRIPTHALLLRCERKEVAKATVPVQVPNVIDAFDNPIFLPVNAATCPPAPYPRCGRPIDLNQMQPVLALNGEPRVQYLAERLRESGGAAGSLTTGREFVLAPIPFRIIEFIPLLLNEQYPRPKELSLDNRGIDSSPSPLWYGLADLYTRACSQPLSARDTREKQNEEKGR